MAKLNVAGLIDGLQGILKAVQTLEPAAKALGLPPVIANVATIAIAATGVIQNVLARGETMVGSLSEQDEAKLRAILADLQASNDQLASVIADDTAEAAEPAKE
jgi:hypothetical protein